MADSGFKFREIFRKQKVYNVEEYRHAAKRYLPRVVFEWIDGGAEDEVTLRDNRAAFDDVKFRPHFARGIVSHDLSTTVLGQRLSLPVLLAPTGLAGIVRPDGELAAVRGAEAAGTRIFLSTSSSYSLEEVAAAAHEPHIFQLYPFWDSEFSDIMVDRAGKAGYGALCVTIDATTVGNRERDIRNGFLSPPRLTRTNGIDMLGHPTWLVRMMRSRRIGMSNVAREDERATDLRKAISNIDRAMKLLNPGFSWDDVARIRDRWPAKLAIKGVLAGEDAAKAVEIGADAVVVSNHGGRQLDGAPASLTALPEVVHAVSGKAQVILDSGVRRGTDVVKALALGADACLIGRPWLFGLAAGNDAGVAGVLEIFKKEITRTLGLIGQPTVIGIDHSALWEAGRGSSQV